MAKKILLVENDFLDQIELERKADTAGYTLIAAGDWATGADKCRLEKPDIIVLDVDPPDEEEMKLLRGMRKNAAPGAKIFVVVGTGKFESMDGIQMKRSHIIDDFIPASTYREIIQFLEDYL